MKHFVFSLALVLALFAGCSEDQISPVPEQPVQEVPIHPVERNAAPILMELEAIEAMARSGDGLAEAAGGQVVELEAGSADGLADAIAEAGPGGIVVVKSGHHTESATVTISNEVRIVGEPGAVLECDTEPIEVVGVIEPALHVQDATGRVVIWGLEIIPTAEVGGTAILIEGSPNSVVSMNTIKEFQFSVVLQYADDARIYGNTIEVTDAWLTGGVADAYGILVINGENAGVKSNDVSGGIFNVWLCDRTGVCVQNNTHEGLIGIILCKVPVYLPMPDGSVVGSDESCNQWVVKGNNATGNLAEGYLIVDGSNTNVLINNRASGNGTYDMELAGETERFGFVAPTSFDNVVYAGSNSMVVKNCGDNNVLIGGTLVDNDLDPCY